jgi:antitoxin ParD1/3/4
VGAALIFFEKEETKRLELIKKSMKGEKSGFVEDFDCESFLTHLRNKYQQE